MTPRLLGGKEVGSLARKVSKFQLDKKGNLVQNGGASPGMLTPSLLLGEALDMQMNVHIIRDRRRLGMVSYHSTANRTWPPPSMSASTGCTVRAFSRMSRLPPVRTDKPTLGWESGVTYKLKVCQHCGKEYQPTDSRQKFCADCGPKARLEGKRVCLIRWREANPEKVRAQSVSWAMVHPEETREIEKRWRFRNPEKVKAKRRRGYPKRRAKRRLLGFTPLNSLFVGCEGHHLDHDRILYIPAELHQSVKHNVWTGKNIEQINALAFQWLEQVTDHVQ